MNWRSFFRRGSKSPAPPANQSEASDVLREIMERHGLTCSLQDDWIVPNGQLPAIRAIWKDLGTHGRLDVHVLLGPGRIIEECFAGLGAGQAAFADGWHNFMVNSLHVLLSSLWSVDHGNLKERWNVRDRQFTAFIGNIGTRAAKGIPEAPPVPSGFIEMIQHRICQEELTSDLHWFRIFFCNIAGTHSYEALRDNQPWQSGLEGLRELTWPETTGYYSYRIFIVLSPAGAAHEAHLDHHRCQ